MIVNVKIKDEFYNIKAYEINHVDNFFITKDIITVETFNGDVFEIGYNEIIEISCVG